MNRGVIGTGRSVTSLDVVRLVNLAPALATPFELWPAVDLKSSISWTPHSPAPGETVRFTIAVESVMPLPAPRGLREVNPHDNDASAEIVMCRADVPPPPACR